MPLPLPLPDIVEIAEYLASHILLEINAGEYTDADLQDSPEISCLEQVAVEAKRLAPAEHVPPAITDVLGRARAAGRVLLAA
jgi:hypothetical protein